jgi:uncharacterized protein YcbK (DUF882 family)
MGNLSEHFDSTEFACPCGCGSNRVDPALVAGLEQARKEYGRPILITCGVRCHGYNAVVSVHELHPAGVAADVAVPGDGKRRYALLAALTASFQRVGIYDRHIHVDIGLPGYPSPWLWTGVSR